jgi:hypothetical protein
MTLLAGASAGAPASLASGFANNVGRLRGDALRTPHRSPKISLASFPGEHSSVFFIQVQEKEGCT